MVPLQVPPLTTTQRLTTQMIRPAEKVFVDTGAWIALAITRDPYHDRARSGWTLLVENGARIVTSLPVVLETFTYLDRRGSRDLALQWKQSLETIKRFSVLAVSTAEFDRAWDYIYRKEFHKLGLVDATSFVLMHKHKIKVALAFDIHFSVAGFRYAA